VSVGQLFGQPAQARPEWEIDGLLHIGRIIKHTKKIDIASNFIIPGAEIGIQRNTNGIKAWQQHWRKPSIGASFIFFQPGVKTHGSAIGLISHMSLPTSRNIERGLAVRLGAGIGWVTKPYHFRDNPNQNAIGTHLNSVIQVRLGWRQRTPRLHYQFGLAFTHFSNGGISQPNFGINMPSGYFVAYKAVGHKKVEPTQQKSTIERDRNIKRWGLLVQGYYSKIEHLIILDGPKYPVYGFSPTVLYRINSYQRLMLGVDFERNEAVYQWFIHASGGADQAKIRLGSTRFGAFLGDEFLFGRFALSAQLSTYIGQKRNAWTLGRIYNKLGFRYFLPTIKPAYITPSIGIQMKAHKSIAEYFALSVAFETSTN
jgi:hypothetical protein